MRSQNKFRLSKGKSVSFQFRIILTVVFMILFFLVSNYVEQQISLYVVLVICTSVAALWFSERIIEFDFDKKHIADKHWMMGWKIGKTIKYSSFNGFRTEIVKKRTQNVYQIFAKFDKNELLLITTNSHQNFDKKLKILKEKFKK